ncbi:MAG: FAD-dependent oxidoreductase [Phycisphaerales bacterium]
MASPDANPTEIATDVLVVGGGCGGVAAAIALRRAGVRCVLTEPTAMLGGQLTSQGVPPDENPWVEGGGPGAPPGFVGCNASYADFRARIRAWYRTREALTDAARGDDRLNPGGGWVSRLCFEPRIGHAILTRMLDEADDGRDGLVVLHRAAPVGAETDRDAVKSVQFDTPGGAVFVRARFVLDATETGDLLDIAGVEHAIGAEAQSVFGELHARDDLPAGVESDPLDQQAITWCFAVEHRPGEHHTIDRPASFDRWSSYVPEMTPCWPGRLFDWTVPSHNEAGRVHLPLVPWPDEPAPGELELWRYRRIVNASIHADARADVSLFNVVQMDFWGAPLLGVDGVSRAAAELAAKEQAACFLYWMQTQAPRHDDGHGYPGLMLRGDVLGSQDGFALAPYIREPRRLRAMQTLTEAHVGTRQRAEGGYPNQDATEFGAGEPFPNAVAIGHYPIDLHPSTSGRNSVYVPACPFRVPLGALVPVRVRNVVAAGKCLGVSHVANGSTRLHPVEWAIGEAAGALAALCVHDDTAPARVFESADLTDALQRRLRDAGVPLAWPWERDD